VARADPHFRGAGPSITLPGGHLALHADFNRDRTRHLERAVVSDPRFGPAHAAPAQLSRVTLCSPSLGTPTAPLDPTYVSECSDCHVAHYSQSHALTSGGTYVPLGSAGPYEHLLRSDVNDLCLTCHDNQSFAPDVFGANGGVAMNRLAGGLNAAPGHTALDAELAGKANLPVNRSRQHGVECDNPAFNITD
jgi:hypothetical protein